MRDSMDRPRRRPQIRAIQELTVFINFACVWPYCVRERHGQN